MNEVAALFERVEVIRSISVVLIGTFLIGNLAWWMRERGVREGSPGN